MDQIYKIGGHCFALPDERLMEVVDGISGFKPFICLLYTSDAADD